MVQDPCDFMRGGNKKPIANSIIQVLGLMHKYHYKK
jgi:hypothetical protein